MTSLFFLQLSEFIKRFIDLQWLSYYTIFMQGVIFISVGSKYPEKNRKPVSKRLFLYSSNAITLLLLAAFCTKVNKKNK